MPGKRSWMVEEDTANVHLSLEKQQIYRTMLKQGFVWIVEMKNGEENRI